MIKFGVIYIEGEKVIVGSNGFCNRHKEKVHYCCKPITIHTWGIRIKGKVYKLSRILAHVFIDDTLDILETRKKRDRVVIFHNNNPFDIRIDNISIVSQKESVNRHHSIEDEIYLVDLNGKIVDGGQKAGLCAKYKINKGTLDDTIKGNNNYCTLTIDDKKIKCVVIPCKDYNRDTIKDVIAAKKNGRKTRKFNKEDQLLQVDIDGNFKIVTVRYARDFLQETGGLNMCLQGKRLTAGGYIWIPIDDYVNDETIIERKLNQVKSNMFYGSKIKLKKF